MAALSGVQFAQTLRLTELPAVVEVLKVQPQSPVFRVVVLVALVLVLMVRGSVTMHHPGTAEPHTSLASPRRTSNGPASRLWQTGLLPLTVRPAASDGPACRL